MVIVTEQKMPIDGGSLTVYKAECAITEQVITVTRHEPMGEITIQGCHGIYLMARAIVLLEEIHKHMALEITGA